MPRQPTLFRHFRRYADIHRHAQPPATPEPRHAAADRAHATLMPRFARCCAIIFDAIRAAFATRYGDATTPRCCLRCLSIVAMPFHATPRCFRYCRASSAMIVFTAMTPFRHCRTRCQLIAAGLLPRHIFTPLTFSLAAITLIFSLLRRYFRRFFAAAAYSLFSLFSPAAIRCFRHFRHFSLSQLPFRRDYFFIDAADYFSPYFAYARSADFR